MRPHRVDFPGARHHVYNRARHGLPIFAFPGACELFIELLALLEKRFGIRVHGYAIMSNHYHLLLESNGNLSAAMQWFFSRFGCRYNAKRPGWDGTLWRGRFQNRVAENDRDWRGMLAYAHLNPVRSKCVRAPEDARWTSCAAYMTGETPDWLATAEQLELHGGRDGLAAFTRAVQERYEKRTPPRRARQQRLLAMRDKGLSVRRIAQHLGKARSTIQRWLHDASPSPFDAWGRRRVPGERAAWAPT
jgi:REP element-mobilizing transposase RayT